MLVAVSVSTWAYKTNSHVYVEKFGVYEHLTIESWGNRTLAQILQKAEITSNDHFDMVTIYLDNSDGNVTDAIPMINAYTLNLRYVDNLGSWKNVKNKYCSNVLFKYTKELGLLDNSVVENFDSEKLYNVISIDACSPCQRAEIDA